MRSGVESKSSTGVGVSAAKLPPPRGRFSWPLGVGVAVLLAAGATAIVKLTGDSSRTGGATADPTPRVSATLEAVAPKLPVILCSGYNWNLDARASENDARCQTLQKPWQPRDLLRKVREGLEQAS